MGCFPRACEPASPSSGRMHWRAAGIAVGANYLRSRGAAGMGAGEARHRDLVNVFPRASWEMHLRRSFSGGECCRE